MRQPVKPYATGDEAGGLRVWDLELGDCTCVLAGHSGAINALSIAASGGVVVSASADGTCRVWDLQQGGACRCVLVGPTGSVKAVAVEPRGRFCVTAGVDGSARVWSLATAACALIVQDSDDNGHPGTCFCCCCSSSCIMHDNTLSWALKWNACTRLVRLI
jgi:WD domain, G-beta repeat